MFVGSAHLDRSILRLESEPNVHFVGVKPYEETLRFIEHFDVALIPHLDNEMTRSMNPLKAFVYCAAGVPVVSTPIANLDELADLITVAEGPIEFAAAIEDALRAGRRPPDAETLAPPLVGGTGRPGDRADRSRLQRARNAAVGLTARVRFRTMTGMSRRAGRRSPWERNPRARRRSSREVVSCSINSSSNRSTAPSSVTSTR